MKKEFLNCVINDRGFKDKPVQITELAPTLRAQDHGNQPKIIEKNTENDKIIVDDTYGFEKDIRIYEDKSPTLRANRYGLKVLSKPKSTDDKSVKEPHFIKVFDISKFSVRRLTPKEYGRLQGFPVDTNWNQVVSDTQAYRQFGNAVTVPLVKSIAEELKDFLNEKIA